MKLLFCKRCQDVVRMQSEFRSCQCGATRGRYLADGDHAEYVGDDAVPLGIANPSLARAILEQPEQGTGRTFTAFVVPRANDKFKRSA